MCRFASLLIGVTIGVSQATPGGLAFGQQGPWYEGFEGPEVSWRSVGGNAQFAIEIHQRVRNEAHTGNGCERVRMVAGNGTEVFLAHDVGRARVIPDLLPTVWVKADRPGLQFLARVVLPQSQHPQTRQKLSTVVSGTSYSTVGRWQQLRIEDIPRLLAREVRVLRAQYGPNVDPRDAYIDRVLLNIYGGPGATNVWIDDLDLAGYVPCPPLDAEPGESKRAGNAWVSVAPIEADPRAAEANAPTAERPERGRVKLSGTVLLIDDRPILPRIIQHRGEPLALLRQLRFNAVWVAEPPGAAMLDEAKRLGLWLVAPPPHGPRADSPDSLQAPRPVLGSQYDGVLAWDLGRNLGAGEAAVTRQWAEQVRMADRRHPGRPVVCGPASELRAYGRCADILLLSRAPLASSLELSDYGTWLREQPQLTRPGLPLWTVIQTQPPETVREQWAGLGRGILPTTFSGDQIQLLVYTALWAGIRGLVFESSSPLSETDADTRSRAAALELINLQLEIAEPWMATGSVVATVPASEPGKGITAAVYQAEHGRLLVPLWSAPKAQYVTGQSAGTSIAFVVPGVPESYNAYHVGPGGLRPLRHKRQTGGVRIVVDEIDLTSMILLTENPLLVTAMTRRVNQASRRWAELQRELAAAKHQTVGQVLGQLPARTRVANEADLLAAAQKALAQCDALLASRDDAGAYGQALRALRGLRLVERATWEAALAPILEPSASPGAVAFPTLPLHVALMDRAKASASGVNLLAGGDFEDFAAMSQAGWRHFQHPQAAVTSSAELSPTAARAGQLGLRLAARPSDPQTPPLWLESPPIWIATPPLAVSAGQTLLIHGWVHVPRPIAASVDGLLIVDSLGGEALAHRVRGTSGWQEFGLYRVAPRSGTLTVTFALAGLGEAWLDDVTIQPLGSTGPPTQPFPK